MHIIDAHSHLGPDCVFDEVFTEADLLAKHARCGVGISIVQPATCHDLPSVRLQHDAIADLCRRYPGHFFGMANPSPHLPDKEYREEIRRCIGELGFVGIKLHPAGHAAPPGGKDSRKVFEAAREWKVPLMIHTGAGIPFANPANVLPMAVQFPEVPIVMAHCGMMINVGEIDIVMERCPNTHADVSWTAGFLIERLVRRFGAQRFLFASDHAENADAEIAKIRACRLTEADQAMLLGGNAESLYLERRIG